MADIIKIHARTRDFPPMPARNKRQPELVVETVNNHISETVSDSNEIPCFSAIKAENVKQTYQFKSQCKDDGINSNTSKTAKIFSLR